MAIPSALPEPAQLRALRERVGGEITGVVVELETAPSAVTLGPAAEPDALKARAVRLFNQQNDFLRTLSQYDVRGEMRVNEVTLPTGLVHLREYRFHYLMNAVAMWVASDDLERLRGIPGVRAVYVEDSLEFLTDRAIDYSLGSDPDIAERRRRVYGATEELRPPGASEAPAAEAVDGFEGQGQVIAIIDSGLDHQHPQFGGSGLTSPRPREAIQPPSAMDHQRVVYNYTFSGSPELTADDFGHGTLVAAATAGYAVDGDTPPNPGYGAGRDGTGIGPTIDGARLHGMAPQALLMNYKVCGPAPNCLGDIPLSIEDAASPITLIRVDPLGLGSIFIDPIAVDEFIALEKPVADVINLSLGSSVGNPASATSVAANNAALAGTIVVSSAGNSGPGDATIGAPAASTLTIAVGANLHPGSTDGADVLAADAVASGATVTGAAAQDLATAPGERRGIKLFGVAGGGAIPDGVLAAEYIYVNALPEGDVPPMDVAGRIALVQFTGAFALGANQIAPLDPAAILLISNTESGTAVAVVNGIPTYTISEADADYLLSLIEGNQGRATPTGTVSDLPLRIAAGISTEAFEPSMASFSSRGPNAHPNARFRTLKPDVTAPGVRVRGAATAVGLPDETVGLASLTGYTSANGTSFSSPITAGAMALIRQYVRNELGFDSTDLSDPDYRSKRFEAVTIARALLQNTATNLRSGLGAADPDGEGSRARVIDQGSGHIDVAAALAGTAIMVAPTRLLSNSPTEFSAPAMNPPDLEPDGSLQVLLPTISFGAIPVVGLDAPVELTRNVTLRDVAGGAGAGSYSLSLADNRRFFAPGLEMSIRSLEGQPLEAITVPAGGEVQFVLHARLDPAGITRAGVDYMGYLVATQDSTGQRLRVPAYLRSADPVIVGATAPEQLAPEGASAGGACFADDDSRYSIRFAFDLPSGSQAPDGFRIEEATRDEPLLVDDASEPLIAGANSTWTGTETWVSAPDPNTNALAYYLGQTVSPPLVGPLSQFLTLAEPITLPEGPAEIRFFTTQSLMPADRAGLEVSLDGGLTWQTAAAYSGEFTGERRLNLVDFGGQEVLLRFAYVPSFAPEGSLGWWISDIRVSSSDYRNIRDLPTDARSAEVVGRENARWFYRVAATYDTPEGVFAGPRSQAICVDVDNPSVGSRVEDAAGERDDQSRGLTPASRGGATGGLWLVALLLFGLARQRARR